MSSATELQISMESDEKLELVHQAIQKILADKTNKEEDQLLLSRLLSEIEMLKEDGGRKEPEGSAEQEASNNLADEGMEMKKEKDDGDADSGAEEIVKELRKVKKEKDDGDADSGAEEIVKELRKVKKEKDDGDSDSGAEEIVKELRKVKRQNLITHCLLSAMIVLTAAWQLSEVSLILRVKDGVNHPFRSLGSMLTGMIKGPADATTAPASDKPNEEHHTKMPSIPLKIPEFPHMDSDKS